MTLTDQLKILGRKIMQNEAQCDLDRKAAKISALSSNYLDKSKYLTGKDLGLKPSSVEQAKFEYSPLGKNFNKGLDKDDDKKERLLQRLKNTEDKNKEQLKAIEDQREVQAKAISKNKIKVPFLKGIYNREVKDEAINNDEAKKVLKTLESMQCSKIDYSKLVYKSGDNQYFDFNKFGSLSNIYLRLINRNIGINVIKLNIEEFRDEIDKLEKKKAKKESYITNKKELLENAKALYEGVKKIMDTFERGLFEFGDCPQIDINYD